MKQTNSSHPPDNAESGFVLITGGAGFIGTNLAHHFLERGRRVRILDNLSRKGVEKNLNWLCDEHDWRQLDIRIEDIRDQAQVDKALADVSQVYHLAAQVAVTTSIENPLEDFEINIRGTLNLLEAIRRQKTNPSLVFTSTNKVYGSLSGFSLRRNGTRYEPVQRAARFRGIDEMEAMQFYSPYGCSKGAADQYVLDYARIFGVRAVVLRMSCIYGPHQFGTEDQGWVANFLIRCCEGLPITIYGDGLQVRDILYVDDLVNALVLCQKHIGVLKGECFNIGGGIGNSVSLVELLALIEQLRSQPHPVQYKDWRRGDQRYYVSDYGRFRDATGWTPAVDVASGIRGLYDWLLANHATVSAQLAEQ